MIADSINESIVPSMTHEMWITAIGNKARTQIKPHTIVIPPLYFLSFASRSAVQRILETT